METKIYNNYRLSGEYVYINDVCIQFDNEKLAKEFLIEITKTSIHY